jgi:hypothetical protein
MPDGGCSDPKRHGKAGDTWSADFTAGAVFEEALSKTVPYFRAPAGVLCRPQSHQGQSGQGRSPQAEMILNSRRTFIQANPSVATFRWGDSSATSTVATRRSAAGTGPSPPGLERPG